MKKFLAIALVLAMVSVANAGVAFVRSDGLTTIGANETITLNLVVPASPAGGSSGFGIGAIDDGDATGSLGSFAFHANVSQVDTGFIQNTEASGGISGCLLSYASAYATTNNIAAGQVIFSMVYTAGSSVGSGVTFAVVPYNDWYHETGGDYQAPLSYIYVGGVSNDIDPLVLTPEPMTLGLLGLGGLFLRRRLA